MEKKKIHDHTLPVEEKLDPIGLSFNYVFLFTLTNWPVQTARTHLRVVQIGHALRSIFSSAGLQIS